MCNSGSEQWPFGCVFQLAGGDSSLCTERRLPIPALNPGESTNITIDIVSPSAPGVYQAKWRMCTPTGCYFGGNKIVNIFFLLIL